MKNTTSVNKVLCLLLQMTHMLHILSYIFQRSAFGLQEAPGVKKSKFFGMVRDALGGVGGSSLSNFEGFLNNFEKLKIQKLKMGRNRFKMG